MNPARSGAASGLCLVLVLVVLSGCDGGPEPAASTTGDASADLTTDAGATPPAPARVLLFTKTAGFRHDSIAAATVALTQVASARGWTLTHTEDEAVFSAAGLAAFDVVVFVHTTGDVLDEAQQAALQAWYKAGHGFAGVHAAADTEHDWTWYGELVGARFIHHTAAGTAGKALVLDRVHPSTVSLPAQWTRTEEWYSFDASPRGKAHVLITVAQGDMGPDHPHAWCRPLDGGGTFYTAGGHAIEAWSEPDFVAHVAAGVDWAAGKVAGDCSATIDAAWRKTVLVENLNAPTELDVAPDGSVYYAERGGALHVVDPATFAVSLVGDVSVTTELEDGLLGLALAPDFASSRQLYLYHSVQSPKVNRLSRFTLRDDGTLDPASAKALLEVPVQRDLCCHSSGSLAFGPGGLLHLSVGDNTNPWESDGFAAIDERPGRANYDAQRTAANTLDLRGKILRIRPKPDGTYEIPAGNLVETANAAPEIFVMGVRNPFRIAVDAQTGRLWWGETGPDSDHDDPARGPRGYDEVNFADTAGNHGWPYCIANNKGYGDWNFSEKKASGPFDCAAPVNASPNNTGAETLPPARPALVFYPYDDSPDFPFIKSFKGRTALMGTVYRRRNGPLDLPAYYEGAIIWMDWVRSFLREIKLDEAGHVYAIVDVAPKVPLKSPIDLAVGPDGAIYLLEWGNGWEGNDGARLVRLDHGGLPVAARRE